mmetsp:Transcript_29799/g.53569  ORF Transcript_29799/g.53569 Transcript_29799/m.53569 type:complete len:425 (-) Transcript_29799:462-1736(-)
MILAEHTRRMSGYSLWVLFFMLAWFAIGSYSQCALSPALKSFIVLKGQGAAGLHDRLKIFLGVGNLAAFLQARVVPEPPCVMLTYWHNHGHHLDCDTNRTWSLYYNLSLQDSEHTAILTVYPDTTGYQIVGGSNKKSKPKKGKRPVVPQAKKEEKVPPKQAAILDEFKQVLSLKKVGRPFIWIFETNWLRVCLRLQLLISSMNLVPAPTPQYCPHDHGWVSRYTKANNLNALCNFVDFTWPTYILALRHLFLTATNLTAQCYVYMHLRRTDMVKDCDSSIEGVVAYVRCILQNVSLPLVFFTDGTPAYAAKLANELHKVYPYPVIYGDSILEPWSRGDNYLRYAVSLAVRQHSIAALERHRLHCKPCKEPLNLSSVAEDYNPLKLVDIAFVFQRPVCSHRAIDGAMGSRCHTQCPDYMRHPLRQ